jgi:hypothetical protein
MFYSVCGNWKTFRIDFSENISLTSSLRGPPPDSETALGRIG